MLKALLLSVVTPVLLLSSLQAATPMPMIVSHRGESKDAPENTMAAFRLAVQRGVGGMECDVYATADGVPVIMHDESMSRTTGVAAKITELTADVVTNTAATAAWTGSGYQDEKVPSLAEYLSLLNGSSIKAVIELKSTKNNVIDAVVAAVRAEPAATKDRVVFISFTAALVQQVRAALPDYPAWLLASNVENVPAATLIANAKACNATGVDVSGTFDAAYVAAVKAAGLAFVTWTVDSVETAAHQAFLGVDGITTNTGKKLMDELPAKIAALDAAAEERARHPAPPATRTAGPDGLVDYESLGSYVTDGLVAFYDGIQNAGDGLPHDSAAAQWIDRVQGVPASFKPAGGNKSGAWTGKGYSFDGVYAQMDEAAPALGTNFTAQIVADISSAAQQTNHFPNIFAAPNDFCAYFNNNDNNHPGVRTSVITFKSEPYASSSWNDGRPSVNWSGRYLTLMFTEDYRRLVFQTATRSGAMARVKGDAVESQAWTWGGSANGPAQRWTKGAYYGVRLYDRALSDEELLANREVDEARYFGNLAVTNVVVAAGQPAGCAGVEAPGVYAVRGSHTFRATNVVDAAGAMWVPAGYRIELRNAAGGWDSASEHAGASYTHVVSETQPAVRLTWKWRLASGLQALDARAYVQEGLLLHFDGIENAGFGVHDAAATVWKNLGIAPTDADVVHQSADPGSRWTDAGYYFDGATYAQVATAVDPGVRYTIQFVCSVDRNENPNPDGSNWPTYFGSPNDQCNLFTGDNGDTLYFKTDNQNGSSSLDGRSSRSKWAGQMFTALFDNGRTALTQTDQYGTWQERDLKAPIGPRLWTIATAGGDNAARAVRFMRGMVHAVRVYNRVLTEAELAWNAQVDQARFRGSPIGDVVVASNYRGAEGTEPAGQYRLGSAHVFTAPATCTTPERDFSLRGYRVESWDAAKNNWLSVMEGTGASVEIVAGDTPVRLTWLWDVTRGLKSGYTLDDYVQDGLLANYDALCNWGRGMPHATHVTFWRDVSGNGNDLTFAGKGVADGAWTDDAYVFNATSYGQMSRDVALGDAFTIEQALTVDTSAQKQNYPNYVATKGDFGIFTRGTGATLEWKDDEWRGANNSRPKQNGWQGRYLVAAYSPTRAWLFQGTTFANAQTRSGKPGIPAYRWSVGAASGNSAESRYAAGSFHATRFYNRTLTEAELARNRRVDEFRFRGAGIGVTNVVVATGRHPEAEGAEKAGAYEVEGAWNFTAAPVSVPREGRKDLVLTPTGYTLETWTGGAWGAPVSYTGTNYVHSVAAQPAPVRLTWTWTSTDGTRVIFR